MDQFPGPVVEPEWLRDRQADQEADKEEARSGDGPRLVIADVRWVPDGTSREVFERGHLPGAVLIDADRDLAAPPFEGPGRHPLPSPEAFALSMTRAGIGDDTPVVVYDDARGSIAARLWWMLDAIGHPVALMDGGLEAWDGPLETGPGRNEGPTRTFTPRPWPQEQIADVAAVQTALSDPNVVVVDVRAPERFRGDIEPFDRVAGHIPGVRNAPWAGNADPKTGRFLSAEALRKRWSALGIEDADRVIAHCGSGLTACHAILSMRVAGLGRAHLYEGSWSDWITDPARPIATADP